MNLEKLNKAIAESNRRAFREWIREAMQVCCGSLQSWEISRRGQQFLLALDDDPAEGLVLMDELFELWQHKVRNEGG